ncbi:MAG: hypothetical protein E7074_08905 [Bacteroidales bacterium]|nr:hypothetical protein [Bacteroidales bacterium]
MFYPFQKATHITARTFAGAKVLLFFEFTKKNRKKVQKSGLTYGEQGPFRQQTTTKSTPILSSQVKTICYALSKIGVGKIDNQWFKGAKMTIVPRPFEDCLMIVSWRMQDGR